MKSKRPRNAGTGAGSSSKRNRPEASEANRGWEKFLYEIDPTAFASDLYIAAGCVMDEVLTRSASVRTAVYAASYQLKKPLLALVTKCMAKLGLIDEIISLAFSRISVSENQLTQLPEILQRILVYDICFGQPSRANQYYRTVKPNETALKSLCDELLQHQPNPLPTTSHYKLPRYVRINQLVVKKRTDVINKLISDKFELVETPTAWSEFCETVRLLQPSQFMRDFHINRSVLVFHPSVQFYQHDLFTSGGIVLQDKASCLAALLLRPVQNSVVVDACAAPGMKTSMLAALLHNTGHIYAVDRDKQRTQTMRQLLTTCRATNVEIACRDFTGCDPHSSPFVDAEYILVDPSCSGSGIVARDSSIAGHGADGQQTYESARLLKLQSFQVMMLKHALTFPNAKRIVYSTCSIFEDENERVIEQALHSSDHAADQFELEDLSNFWAADDKIEAPGTNSTSDGVYDDIRAKCLRLSPDTHLTNGFFIAVLVKKPT